MLNASGINECCHRSSDPSHIKHNRVTDSLHPYLVMGNLLLVLWVMMAFASTAWPEDVDDCLTDGWEEYTISIRTPNITLADDYVFICVSADLPPSQETSYITGIFPQPIAGMNYHIITVGCGKAGYEAPAGQPSVWECGQNVASARNPPLTHASECASKKEAHGTFKFQFQGGSSDEGALRLPHGTGIPVGGKTGTHSLVFSFHFPSRAKTNDGTTGETEVDVRLVRPKPQMHQRRDMKSVASISFKGLGFVAPMSTGPISMTWTLKQDIPIQPLLLYTHTHDLATDVRIDIVRKDGGNETILAHDPRTHRGMTTLSPMPQIMTPGDKIHIQCTYNNSLPISLRVETREMCVVFVYYSVVGNRTLDVREVNIIDPKYKDCFPTPLQRQSETFEVSFEGRSSFQDATTEDCLFYDASNDNVM